MRTIECCGLLFAALLVGCTGLADSINTNLLETPTRNGMPLVRPVEPGTPVGAILAAWGQPDETHVSGSVNGVIETLQYGHCGSGRPTWLITLHDGYVISWSSFHC
jgi:hypothetical protein